VQSWDACRVIARDRTGEELYQVPVAQGEYETISVRGPELQASAMLANATATRDPRLVGMH
jgi:hypothetical protein